MDANEDAKLLSTNRLKTECQKECMNVDCLSTRPKAELDIFSCCLNVAINFLEPQKTQTTLTNKRFKGAVCKTYHQQNVKK